MKLNKSLIKGSLILIIAFGFFNFFNFIFQLIMARMLPIVEYGVLATLFAIIYIILVFSESVQTIITKYSSNEKNKGKLKNILKKSINKAFFISISLFIFYLILAIFLSYILKINYLLLSMNGLVIFLAFLSPITRGIMQGKKRFNSLGINMIIESIVKLLIGIFLVTLGWKVYGAVLGVVLGGFFAFLLSFLSLKDIIRSKEDKSQTIGIYNYAKPAFIIMTIIVVFYSLDVILAKIFFSPELAGAYAISSILGKIVFWGTLPVSKVMFPISSEENGNKKNSENIFFNSMGLVIGGIALLLCLFFLFPDSIIRIFSGKNVPEASAILLYSGIAFSFISLSNLLLMYRLSLEKVRGYGYLFIFILIEIILLSVFSKNLLQYSIAYVTSCAIFLWGAIMLPRE